MKRIIPFLVLVMLVLNTGIALAQDYSYNVEELIVNVFWNEDGTQSLDYLITFSNSPSGHAIEYVDLAMPNNSYDESSIYADSMGIQLTDISSDDFQGTGSGVAIYMAGATIPPGESGTVHVFVGMIEDVLYEDPGEDEYASAVFAPARFEQPYAYGDTNMTVIFHLPPGVTDPNIPRYHEAPAGWTETPVGGIDDTGRFTYTWNNPSAAAWQEHELGASFPLAVVPGVDLQSEPVDIQLPAGLTTFFNSSCCIPALCIGFFGLVIGAGIWGDRNRKMKYLPPKISIEGNGIKRGLTAVEAAVVMETPVDKVFTMILFGLLKKGAAEVTSKDPLQVAPTESEAELHFYEKEFVQAFQLPAGKERQKALQDLFVTLIKAVTDKMKGFSRSETVAYYKDINRRAWAQVESANTPEVKSEKYDEYMEWTMLDRDWSGRTRDVFRTGPVFMPVWFPRYNPGGGFPRGTVSTGGSRPSMSGADFANSVTGGLQTFAAGVVGNISDFTNKITNITNPPPPPSTRSGGYRGGGGGCACACACAGCACACAGGGR